MTDVGLHPQWIVPQWPAPPVVRALITTRAGGFSTGAFGAVEGGGMNLGLKSGDAVETVQANRARLRAVLPAAPRWLQQVHGAAVADIDATSHADVDATNHADNHDSNHADNHATNHANNHANNHASNHADAAPADAAISLRPRRVCVVSIADCLPVFFADRRGRAVGVAHAGWRGLAAGILQNTATALRERLGEADASLLAYLGPAIGPSAFEVGPDVLAAMRERLPQADAAFRPRHGTTGKYLCDLFALARQALAQVAVTDVYGGGDCTYSDPRRFYSYRRDGVTGRHAALIWIER
jgi:YfiH family protein